VAIEIFKPGKFRSVEGAELEFTPKMLEAIVANYSRERWRAPLVVGHPKMDDPAYGYADALSINENGVVVAEPADVDPQFAELVNAKRYSSISASFWPPGHPRNPAPEGYYLRHVGFLGAVPPAVAGLKSPSFADGDAPLFTVDFSCPSDTQEPDMTKENEIAQREKELQTKEASFADQQKTLAQKEAEIAAREKAIADRESAARKAEIASFAEGLCAAGKLLPAEKAGITALLETLPSDSVVSFADVEGKEQKKSPGEFVREFLAKLPPRVDFAERAGAEQTDTNATASFAAPTGFSVDKTRLESHNKALAYQAQHKCDYVVAVAAVGG
jgi:Uncharacterized protein conserved in bacteria with the myosin-like domain